LLTTALVTGATRGIGFEIGRQLAWRGWHVVLGAREVPDGQKAVEMLGHAASQASFLLLDVRDSASIHEAARAFSRMTDRLNVLINNAGIYPDEGVDILTISRDQLTATFQTNTFGPVIVTQAFLPFLRQARRARVINVASGYGQLAGLSPEAPSYCLSKLALHGVTVMFAEALKTDGIAVNAMCPGWVRTAMGGPTAPRSVEEGADTAVWLATEAPRSLPASSSATGRRSRGERLR
jgi:NAD(P)-dependent dehydrogenase (short-subunit alcohol dehydrogenase family)